MSWHHSIYGDILLGTSLLSLWVAYYSWKHRALPGNRYFLVIMLSASFWALTGALEAYVQVLEEKTFWSQISYFGIVNTSPAWFCFALHYCGYSRYITPMRLLALWSLPPLFVAAALTNNYHHLIWTKTELVPNPLGMFVEYHHGPLFWVMVVYLYILNISAAILFIRQTRIIYKVYQRQAAAVLLSALIPWIGNIIYNFRLGIPSLDTTPIAFTISGAVLLWSVMQHRLFNIAPIAHDVLFATMQQLVVVVDLQKRIIDINYAAQKFFEMKKSPIGMYCEQSFEQWKGFSAFITSGIASAILPLKGSGDTMLWFKAAKSEIKNAKGVSIGTLVVCYDITEQKKAEDEKEKLIMELMDALSNVKTLSGLLPICSNCKKIRDDAGYWQQVETYVAKHTQASFTHGVCPDCIEKLYGDYLKK